MEKTILLGKEFKGYCLLDDEYALKMFLGEDGKNEGLLNDINDGKQVTYSARSNSTLYFSINTNNDVLKVRSYGYYGDFNFIISETTKTGYVIVISMELIEYFNQMPQNEKRFISILEHISQGKLFYEKRVNPNRKNCKDVYVNNKKLSEYPNKTAIIEIENLECKKRYVARIHKQIEREHDELIEEILVKKMDKERRELKNLSLKELFLEKNKF